ncbi:MAG: hypothetical protein ACRERE_01075 [Candidatus Entotheonellia bacterium]
MPIDFHAETNRHTYTTREAHPTWLQTITAITDPHGKRVIDVGCGGTYAHAWAQLGAAEVIGRRLLSADGARGRRALPGGGTAHLAAQ